MYHFDLLFEVIKKIRKQNSLDTVEQSVKSCWQWQNLQKSLENFNFCKWKKKLKFANKHYSPSISSFLNAVWLCGNCQSNGKEFDFFSLWFWKEKYVIRK